MKIDGVTINEMNLEDYYEFSEEEFLGRTDVTCGCCKGKGCIECAETGEITDETNPDHSCSEYESDDIDFDYDTHASIDRICLECNQLSRLHFWRKKQ